MGENEAVVTIAIIGCYLHLCQNLQLSVFHNSRFDLERVPKNIHPGSIPCMYYGQYREFLNDSVLNATLFCNAPRHGSILS